MNFDELSRIVANEAGVSICPICGMPFTKYHSRQIICPSPECRKAHRAEYYKKRTAKLREEDIDVFRKKHNEAQKKYRQKKKEINTIDDNLKKTQEYWERRSQAPQIEKTDGKAYAEKQIEKTLSQVPKIDVNMGGAKDDNVHSKNESK